MKKIILVIVFLIGLTSLAESQTRLKFGNVFLKDTLSGDMKLTTGNIWTSENIYSIGGSLTLDPVDGTNTSINFLIGSDDDIRFLRGDTVIYRYTGNGGFSTFYQKLYASDDFYVAGNTELVGNATVGDNLTADSIFSTRTSGVIGLVSDDSLITITSSVMMISSDNGTATNRTFTISDGATVGQTLTIILWESGGTDKCELVDDANVGGLNGTMTFDADMDNVSLIWYGIWIELSRTEH